MSIATQIQRLINAKKAIKSSIVNKSVTVADTVKLDGYGTLINQIGVNANIGPNDVIKGKMAFGNNGKYFNGTALSVQTSANNARILNGFTAYDSNGQLLTGNAMPSAATALNNRIMNGFTAYDNQGNLLKGNAFINNTNATNASLLKGHTAYLNNGFYLNGTAFGNNTNANNATILNGYTAYLNNGSYLKGTYVPMQVQTGSVSETDNIYTISTSFTPKGFVMFTTTRSESSNYDRVFCLFDTTASQTVTAYCTHSVGVHHGIKMLSALFRTAAANDVLDYLVEDYYGGEVSNVEFNPFVPLYNENNGEAKASILEQMFLDDENDDDGTGYQAQMADDSVFNLMTGDSTITFDEIYSRASAYMTNALISLDTTCSTFYGSASYSSTGATITIPTTVTDTDDNELKDIRCYSMNYVIWG